MSGHTWGVVTQLHMADHPASTLKQVVANEGLELPLAVTQKTNFRPSVSQIEVFGVFQTIISKLSFM